MKHLYLFTLEVTPLETGRVYDELPSHLTLMSRFLSELSPDELAGAARSLFTAKNPITLVLGDVVELGPQKITAHIVSSHAEQMLHYELCQLLDPLEAEQQYPQFIGAGLGRIFQRGRMHLSNMENS